MATCVLVAGLGCGGWAWAPVARLLSERGHRTAALTMPGMGFERVGEPSGPVGLPDAVAAVTAAVTAAARDSGERVTLLAHSWGGIPATGAAVGLGPDVVEEVVYCSAVVPQAGRSMRDENAAYAAVMDAALREDSHLPVDPAAIAAAMMQDESAEVQRLVTSLMVATPGRYLTDPPAFGTVAQAGVAARYLLFADDQALARPGAEFAARIGLVPRLVPGSHMALVTRPDALAAAILDDGASSGRSTAASAAPPRRG